MKCTEAEINTVNIKCINEFLEAQSSELRLWINLLKRRLEQDKIILSFCFSTLCLCHLPKVEQNRSKLKYQGLDKIFN